MIALWHIILDSSGKLYFNLMTKAEKINLAATVGGPFFIAGVIGWVAWSLNAKMDLRQADVDKKTTSALTAEHDYNAKNFVDKDSFVQAQKETSQHLQSIDDKMSQVRVDIATVNGKIETQQKGK
jgi:hypothetical protein